jgi:hypothetical protein
VFALPEVFGRGIRSRFFFRNVVPPVLRRCRRGTTGLLRGAPQNVRRRYGASRAARASASSSRARDASVEAVFSASARVTSRDADHRVPPRHAGNGTRRGGAATAPRRRRSKQKGTLIRQCSTRTTSATQHAGSRVALSMNVYATAAETAVGGRWRDAFLFGSPWLRHGLPATGGLSIKNTFLSACSLGLLVAAQREGQSVHAPVTSKCQDTPADRPPARRSCPSAAIRASRIAAEGRAVRSASRGCGSPGFGRL